MPATRPPDQIERMPDDGVRPLVTSLRACGIRLNDKPKDRKRVKDQRFANEEDRCRCDIGHRQLRAAGQQGNEPCGIGARQRQQHCRALRRLTALAVHYDAAMDRVEEDTHTSAISAGHAPGQPGRAAMASKQTLTSLKDVALRTRNQADAHRRKIQVHAGFRRRAQVERGHRGSAAGAA